MLHVKLVSLTHQAPAGVFIAEGGDGAVCLLLGAGAPLATCLLGYLQLSLPIPAMGGSSLLGAVLLKALGFGNCQMKPPCLAPFVLIYPWGLGEYLYFSPWLKWGVGKKADII